MATTESIEPGWVKSCCQKNGDQGCFVTVIYCVLYYSVKQENLCRWTKLGNNARWTNRKCENVIKFEALSIFFYTLQSAWRPTLRNGGRSRTVLSCKTQLPRGPGKFWQLSVLLYLFLIWLLDCSRDLGLSERGFGFVTFKDPSAVQSVVTQGPHILDNKTVSLS